MMKQYVTSAKARWGGWQLGGALLLACLGAGQPAQAQQVGFSIMQAYGSGGTEPYGMAVADLNADGRPDLITGNSNSASIGVLLATATAGSFATAVTYTAGVSGQGPLLLTVGDVNGDNRPDVVASTYQTQRVLVYLNSATNPGTLLPAATYSTTSAGTLGRALALGDVNGDGRPDLIVGGFNSGNVAVLLNQATAPGTFGAATTYTTSSSSGISAVALADLNADGRPELVVLDYVASVVRVLPGLTAAAGTFGTPVSYPVGGPNPYGLVVGDANGDNRPDVLTAGVGSSSGILSVLLNSATTPGTLLPAATYNTGGATGVELALGDLNNDGRPDVAVSNLGGNSVGVLLGSATAPGTFGTVTAYTVGTGPRSVVIADVNRDNKRDIVVANFGSNTVGVLYNTAALATAPGLAAPADVAVYPNPAHEQVSVTLPASLGATAAQAELLDALGRVVQRHRAALPGPGSAFLLPTATLPAGLYLLRLTALDAQGATLGTLPTQRLAVE